MSLNIRPILSALLRNRTGAVLVALQIALALAILVNATYIVKQRVDSINRPTGIDDANIFAIESSGFTSRYDYATSVRDDLDYLRGLNGVIAATPSNGIPLSGRWLGSDRCTSPLTASSPNPVNVYHVRDGRARLQTLGAHLIAGRNFRKEEIMPPLTTDNQSRPYTADHCDSNSLAQPLFPDGKAVGKVIYDTHGRPSTIIGVITNVAGPWDEPASTSGACSSYPSNRCCLDSATWCARSPGGATKSCGSRRSTSRSPTPTASSNRSTRWNSMREPPSSPSGSPPLPWSSSLCCCWPSRRSVSSDSPRSTSAPARSRSAHDAP